MIGLELIWVCDHPMDFQSPHTSKKLSMIEESASGEGNPESPDVPGMGQAERS